MVIWSKSTGNSQLIFNVCVCVLVGSTYKIICVYIYIHIGYTRVDQTNKAKSKVSCYKQRRNFFWSCINSMRSFSCKVTVHRYKNSNFLNRWRTAPGYLPANFWGGADHGFLLVEKKFECLYRFTGNIGVLFWTNLSSHQTHKKKWKT